MSVQGQQKKSLKEVIAEEYRKCAADPVYFMKKYCVIQHPTRGKIPFRLYPFQEDCLNDFKDNRFNITFNIWIETDNSGIGFDLDGDQIFFLYHISNQIRFSFLTK